MGYAAASVLVSAEWVNTHRENPDVIILDCRWRLGDPEYGHRVFTAGHIPGAQRADMERDWSAPPARYGGRHPLPTPEDFENSMRRVGVHPSSTIIVYDDDAAGAARAWWCLTYFGHPAVHILDGGMAEWLAWGGSLESGPETPAPSGTFHATPDPRMVVGYATVNQLRGHWPIIDARAPERYWGSVEPIDARAGHIPGALNLPYAQLLAGSNRYRAPEDIRRIASECIPDDRTDPIVYCGSGVSACVLAAALRTAGLSPLLYPGSWSDWIAHEDAPLAGSTPSKA
jgi:thiosulfate/3-mercaptopyruvate sulfurtransferase